MSFSASYKEARARFIEVCHGRKGKTWSFFNPHAVGYENEPLYMDAIRIGPQDVDVLVLTLSGTGAWRWVAVRLSPWEGPPVKRRPAGDSSCRRQ
jgi:hypothetical protein